MAAGTVTKNKSIPLQITQVFSSLRWRHNDHDGVSNHQPHGCLLNRLFRRRSKKTSKIGTGEFPAQRASDAENVSIWWRQHALWISLITSNFCCLHQYDPSMIFNFYNTKTMIKSNTNLPCLCQKTYPRIRAFALFTINMSLLNNICKGIFCLTLVSIWVTTK